MSFPRYERYKDSGVEWLGEIPEHWEVTKVKRVATKIGSGKTPRGGSEVYVSDGVIFLRSQNVHDSGLRLDDVVHISLDIDEEMDNTRVQAGDILLNVTGASIGRTTLVPSSLGAANVSQHVCIIRVPNVDARNFLAAALQGHVIKSQIELAQNGAAREGLNFEQIGNLVFALPRAAEELQAVADFLKRELERIDTLIDEQQFLIELLNEKRQAVISHAVSKGLNANVPLRDSGIEWLGEIPAHWPVEPLKRAFSSMDYGISESLDSEGAVAILRMGNIQDGRVVTDDLKYVDCVDPALILREGDLLYNRTNSLDLIGKVGMFVGGLDLPVSFASYLVRLRTVEESIPAYFAYLLNTEGILGIARSNAFVAIGQCNLNPTRYGQLSIALPPLDEQIEITNYLDKKIAQIAVLREEAETAITIFLERRSALISAAVTGSIDIRAYMAKPAMSATQYSSGFAHQLLAAEILDRCNSQRMGRIKLQKLIHLCEYHGQVSEVQGDYSRKAAGPFDARAMAGISKNLKKQKWFEEVKEGERYVYRPLEKCGEHKKYLTHWQTEMPRIDEVLGLLGNFRTRECEIISTLYAAWNDLLIDGEPTDDAAILHEASSAERWHKSKEQIAPERWKKALQWMKDMGLVPVGYGKHTRHTAGPIGTTTEEAHEPA
jgi:type I restriction enzyme S subunit